LTRRALSISPLFWVEPDATTRVYLEASSASKHVWDAFGGGNPACIAFNSLTVRLQWERNRAASTVLSSVKNLAPWETQRALTSDGTSFAELEAVNSTCKAVQLVPEFKVPGFSD
jgi:hypothetical protein